MNKDIETEIKHRFYRPAVSSVKLYREKLRAAQDAAVLGLTRAAARKWKFWSLLVTVSALSAAAQAHA
jgi:hypothetical protein